LARLGVRLDSAANDANAMCISTPESRVAVHVIATDVEAVIALRPKNPPEGDRK
jgi:acetate kinase